jgi:hypothetical protein
MSYFIQDSGVTNLQSLSIFACTEICKWINQAFDSWNFIQHIIVKIIELSTSLCRSLHKDSNKKLLHISVSHIYFICYELLNFMNGSITKERSLFLEQVNAMPVLARRKQAARRRWERERKGGDLTGAVRTAEAPRQHWWRGRLLRSEFRPEEEGGRCGDGGLRRRSTERRRHQVVLQHDGAW